MARLTRLLEATGSLLALLLLWYLLARFGGMSEFLLPGPAIVAERIIEDAGTGDLWKSLLRTLQTAMTGFALAAFGGTILGILMARVRVVRWFFDPLVSLGFPMPKIAFLPVFLLCLGPTPAAQITIVAVSAIFPVAVAAVAAAEGVEKTWLWSARSLGGTNTGILWQVVLPAITPQVFTGLQIGLPVALVTTIVAEMLTGSDGIGGSMLSAMRFADSPGVFAGIIVIAATGMLVIRTLELTRRYLLRWHQEQA